MSRRRTLTSFRGAVCVVTGAASGLGAELVRQLVDRGAAHVYAADVAEEALDAVVAALASVSAVPTDVTDPDAVEALVARPVAEHGRVDVVINNAGIVVAGDTEKMDLPTWERIVGVNQWGVVHGTQAAYRAMLGQAPGPTGSRGHIVNVASSAGVMPVPKSVAYAMTKHAVVGLSVSLRAEAADRGVRVSAAVPGLIETGIAAAAVNLPGHDYAESMSRVPIGAISAGSAARSLLDGVERNRRLIVFPRSNAALALANRLLPGVMEKAIAAQTR
jgi:NAD(P)-dependent dehydrogenase (short-subunit alcohol dehydrogenase family)